MQIEPVKFRNPFSNFNINATFKIYDTDSLQTFFKSFRLKCYLLLLFSPVGLGASAYLAQASFGLASTGISVGLFLLSLLLLLPWTLVPILLLFTNFPKETWQRKLSWAYVGLLVVSYFYWIIYF